MSIAVSFIEEEKMTEEDKTLCHKQITKLYRQFETIVRGGRLSNKLPSFISLEVQDKLKKAFQDVTAASSYSWVCVIRTDRLKSTPPGLTISLEIWSKETRGSSDLTLFGSNTNDEPSGI